MEVELRDLLAGFDPAVVHTLASNDIRSVADAKLLSSDDLKELQFSLGVRNRLLKLFADTPVSSLTSRASIAAKALGGSVKNLLESSGVSFARFTSAPAPPDLATFKATFEPLTSETPASLGQRNKLYPAWDTNDNGFLSLAEVDQGVKINLIGTLKNAKEGERVWRRFRKSYIRAFLDAADASPQRKKGATVKLPSGKRRTVCDDDYVTQREFRLLICYLSLYATMYELFALIDGGSEGFTAEDDARISRAEWDAAMPGIMAAAQTWAPFVALQQVNPDGSDFGVIDANGGGFILLTELCEWIENGEKAAKTSIGALLGVGE